MIKKVARIDIETNASEAKTKIDSLSDSTNKLSNSTKNNTGSIVDSNNSMKIADSLTGGLASRIKNAADSTGLLSVAQKSLNIATEGGTSAMRLFQVALASTGIGAIIIAVGLLIDYFKDFDPLIDKIEQGMAAFGAAVRVVQQALASLFSSSEDSAKSFNNLGDKMAKAARDAAALKEAQQDLADDMNAQDVANARASQKYDELIVKSKNRTLSEKERIEMLQEADKIEAENFKQRSALVDKDLAQAREAARIKGDLSKQEIQNLKNLGTEYAIQLQNQGKITEKEVELIKKAELAKIDIQKENTSRTEKSQNRQNALAEKAEAEAQAAREKAAEKRKEVEDKAAEERKKKREKELEEEKKAISDLNEFRKQVADANKEQFDKEIQNKLEAAAILKSLEPTETPAQKLEREFKEKEAVLIAANESTIGLQSKYIQDSEKLEEDAKNKSIRTAQDELKAKTALKKAELDGNMKHFKQLGNLMQTFGQLAGEQTAAGKALGIASATINTFIGISEIWAAKSMGNPAFDMAIKIASTAAVAAAGFANVKSILDVKVPGNGGGGSVPSLPAQPSVSFQNTPQTQISDTIAQAEQNRNQQPIKTYVTVKDINTAQELDRNVVNGAKF